MIGYVFDLPLRVPFRGITRRSGMVFEGPAGWAEWSPFPEYGDDEAAVWMRAAREAANLSRPPIHRDQVEVNGIVPALPPGEAAQRALASGCRTIKIKVGIGSLEEDLLRVSAVRAVLPEARLRVDANGAWGLAEATEALTALAPLRLEYVEQPCATVAELAELRRRELGVPIAADESIRRAADPLRVRDAGAADVAVLKVQPLGGVSMCLSIAEQLGLPVVISSAVESSVGLAMSLVAAAALPTTPLACGLETGKLLGADLVANSLLPTRGVLDLQVIAPEPDLLVKYGAGPELTKFWWDRWQRVSKILEEDQ